MANNSNQQNEADVLKKRSGIARRNEKIFYYGLMFLPLVQFCIFYIGVNFQSIGLAFSEYKSGEFVLASDFFANFKEIFKEFTTPPPGGSLPPLVVAFRNSLILWFFNSLCGTAIAVFFSYYVFKRKSTGRFFRFILFLPSILPAVLMGRVFWLFTGDVLPKMFGVEAVLTHGTAVQKLASIIGYSVWVSFGTQVLLYSNAMEQLSPSVLEAAQLDGVTPMGELLRIIFPNLMPTVSTFMIASIAGAFMNQANLYTFYGETAMNRGGIHTVGYYLFVLVQENSQSGVYGKHEFPFASALGLFCTCIAIPLTVLFRKFSKRFED